MCCVCSLVLALDVKYFRNNININNDDDDDNNNKDIKTRRWVTSALPGHAPTPRGHPGGGGGRCPWAGNAAAAQAGAPRPPPTPGARLDSEVPVEIKAGAGPPGPQRSERPLWVPTWGTQEGRSPRVLWHPRRLPVAGGPPPRPPGPELPQRRSQEGLAPGGRPRPWPLACAHGPIPAGPGPGPLACGSGAQICIVCALLPPPAAESSGRLFLP